MPQMAPLLWLPFVLLVMLALYFTNSLLYFQPNLVKKETINFKTKENTWLW